MGDGDGLLVVGTGGVDLHLPLDLPATRLVLGGPEVEGSLGVLLHVLQGLAEEVVDDPDVPILSGEQHPDGDDVGDSVLARGCEREDLDGLHALLHLFSQLFLGYVRCHDF